MNLPICIIYLANLSSIDIYLTKFRKKRSKFEVKSIKKSPKVLGTGNNIINIMVPASSVLLENLEMINMNNEHCKKMESLW